MAAKVSYVVKSAVKATIAKGKMHSASDMSDALNNLVHWYLESAIKRAKSNGRKTVRGHDIHI